MAIELARRGASAATLQKRFGAAAILDLTSRGPEPWVRFSPFYPHGGIPVPFSPGEVAASVEGIWQGLKVFEREDVDKTKLGLTAMRGIKRSAQKLGRILGHRAGLGGERLLSYAEARRAIYLPSYRFVLENRLSGPLGELRALAAKGPVVLLDYETNADVADLSRPLSHASLVRAYIEGRWPEEA
jgi:hypothetical protein